MSEKDREPLSAILGEETRARFLAIAPVKRFVERWMADPDFRRAVQAAPQGAADRYGIPVDADAIRELWDPAVARTHKDDEKDGAASPAREYRELQRLKLTLRDEFRRRASPSHPRFKAWRARQMARCEGQFGKNVHDQIVHSPVAFELNKGCSVGCSFCGISAPRMTDIFAYDDQNRVLWREALGLMREICGPAAQNGFCYWATDPMDNPDYEKFCTDFHEILGAFPVTTTALPLKDPARTRALLALSREKGCPINRFSVITLPLWDRLFEEFSAEELLFVECLPLNKESDLVKASAGRYREGLQKSLKLREDRERKLEAAITAQLERLAEPLPEGAIVEAPGPETIACVSGFLVNMIDRRVKLISPCVASDRWPLGYMIFEEGSFTSIDGLREIVVGMIDRHMPETLPDDQVLRFRQDLVMEKVEHGFHLKAKLQQLHLVSPGAGEYLQAIGTSLEAGNDTSRRLALILSYTQGVSENQTLSLLNDLFQKGALDEEPAQTGRTGDRSGDRAQRVAIARA